MTLDWGPRCARSSSGMHLAHGAPASTEAAKPAAGGWCQMCDVQHGNLGRANAVASLADS